MAATVAIWLLRCTLIMALAAQTFTPVTGHRGLSEAISPVGSPEPNDANCQKSGSDKETYYVATSETDPDRLPRYGFYRDRLLTPRLRQVYEDAGVSFWVGSRRRCGARRAGRFTQTAAIHARVVCSLVDVCDPVRETLRAAIRQAVEFNSTVFLIRDLK